MTRDEFTDLVGIEYADEYEKTQLSQEDATKDAISDTISRQAAIDAVDAIGHIATMPDGDKCIRRSAVKYTLSMLPSAQPEREKGEWIEALVAGMPAIHHKKCGAFVYAPNGKKGFNFCPNCGAKMEEKQYE